MAGTNSETELASEQAWLDAAYDHLAAMQDRADAMLAVGEQTVRDADSVDARVARFHLARRVESLQVGSGPLCFGRIDAEDGNQWYVGRRHVEDGAARPVVVDWRAPVSAAFYRATAIDPLGLTLRRRFIAEEGRLVDLLDEDLTDPEATGGSGLPDPLLAELERSRSDRMHDIVATIAAEQDEIIRAPLDAVVIVQGGPGTGKTAVGLHRAAFLLFEHRARLEEQRVLVIGPNPVFLRYIAEVLPSLGETAVSQSTLVGLLAARTPVRAEDPPEVTALKGRAEMAEVITAAISARIKPLADGLTLRGGSARVHLEAGDLENLQKRVLGGTLPVNQGRGLFRRLIVQEAWRRHSVRPGVDVAAEPVITAAFRADKALDAAVTRMWPTLNPAIVVRDLYRSPARLRAAAAGLLDAGDLARLGRKAPGGVKAEPWTAADIPLVDEATARIEGVPATYGHVVVDEAQDLPPMALRMAARRAGTGSMTVLGDLAQATAPGVPGSWESTRAALTGAMTGTPAVESRELTVGYRVPASILDVANALLPEAAPGVTPAASVRPGGDPPLVLEVADAGAALDHAVVTEAAALRDRMASVAVVAPARMLDRLEGSLRAAGVPAERVEGRGLPGSEAVALLDPAGVKGLEFDAVIVVEPGEIVEAEHGLRHLYVAMTRAVQHLGVIHHRPLPPAIA